MHGIGLGVLLWSCQPLYPEKSKLLCLRLLTLYFYSIALSNGSRSFAKNQISNGSNRGKELVSFCVIFVIFISFHFGGVKQLNAKVTKNQSIVSTMFQDLKAKVRITNSKENIIQDVIPFSLPIITPTLRPVCCFFLPYLKPSLRK